MTPIDTLLPLLQKVRKTRHDRWIACCPAHDDKNPSLSIQEQDDGTLLIYCHSLCAPAHIVAAVGLELKDLFPQKMLPVEHPFSRSRPKSPPRPKSYREIIANMREDLLALSIGFSELKRGHLLTLEDLERLDEAALRCYAIATLSL
jgi:hypothetical protein